MVHTNLMECATTSSKPLLTPPVETRELELVKYMSKLPVFLERAETTTPLLSVGVLHWSRLEKWHHSHNRMVIPSSLVPPRDADGCPRKHRQSSPVEETLREYRSAPIKKPKDHIGPNTDGCEKKKKGLKGNISPKISECVTLSTKASNTSSGGKLSASSLLSVKHCTDEPSQRQDSKSYIAVSENGRSISPFQRLMGKASKTNSAGSTSQLDSMENSSKTVSQNITLSSVSEKDTTTTSHLRRFLKPLLKPRETHSGNSVEGPRGITGCRTVNVNDSAYKKKAGSSMVRAVLQVTVKNNQPLFTFAVNKETNVIAATQKKMGSSEEGECISVYTFFSIKDHKRKSSWLNQRGRGQTHGIISNVVAQMRVSSSFPSGSLREFVLFSVELDMEKSDLQLKNELAAIIVKIPRWFSTVQDHNAFDKEVEDNIKDISATVILQSGVHSMPHKGGGPSSLIQRWRTGGSCDCGGWDMGCNLRILTNQHNFSCKSSTTTSNSPPLSNPFELFFLGEQAEEHPFLSYKPIKEGIYSVVYDLSLSQLQAFSICMALAECRKVSELHLEHKSSCDEHKARAETVLIPGPRFKAL
ncbi:hypothetical protein N665_1683s0006 [Sinapis alba]|nr:hypothetical protein N665_1683s0006 [Sinapis alba]